MQPFEAPEALDAPLGEARHPVEVEVAMCKAVRYLLKVWLPRILKFCFTFFLLWLACRKVRLRDLETALGSVRPGMAIVSIALFVACTILAESGRFASAGSLLAEPQPSYTQWLFIFTESRPFYYLLPASVGAEGMIWIRLRQFQWRHASCDFAVILTRFFGVGGWALVAALSLASPVGAALILVDLPAFMRLPWLWMSGGVMVLALAMLAPWFMDRYKGLPVGNALAKGLARLTLTTLLSVLATTLGAVLAASAAGTPLNPLQAAGFVAIFNFAMVLPISLGGFGLQEALVLRLGIPMGYSPAALIAFSVVLHLQRIVLSLVGGGLFLARKQRQA